MAQAANQGNVRIFLQINGVTGESTDAAYAKQIECTLYKMGIKNQSSVASGTTGSGSGRAVFEEMELFAPINSASPTLMQAAASGQTFSNATITFVKAGGGTSVVYLTIKLTQVFLSTYDCAYGPVNPNDSSSPLLHVDKYGLTYGSISFAYNQQTASGGLGAQTAGTYNLLANAIGL